MRPPSPLRRRFGVLAVGVLVVAIVFVTAAPALASSGPQYGTIGQYGEVWRGGGFDKSGYNNGHYGGPITPGKFIDPVGFAVDTHDTTPGGDGTAVYVLDRTSNLPGNVTGAVTTWRLQKLSDTGVVLGTSQFSLPANSATNTNSYQMLGLAVDPAVAGHTTGGRVYALVEAYDVNVGIEYADEIVAWSTTPTGTQLVAPTGMPADKLSKGIGGTPPGLLSSSSQLISGGNPSIQNPQGLALDISGAADDLAVQGNDGTTNGGGSGIAQVSATTGAIAQQWSSSVLSTDPNDNGDEGYPPAGISTAANGSLIVLLNAVGSGQASSNIDVVDVPADLTSTPTILSSGINAPFGGGGPPPAPDNAAVSTGGLSPEAGDPDGLTAGTNLAGPQVVGLSNGLYAGEFEPDPVGQPDGQNPAQAPGLWTQTNPAARLLMPESNGTLSNPQPPMTSLFDTLGNPTVNQTGTSQAASACNLSDPLTASPSGLAAPSLAAGAAGSLWVLTRGIDSSAIPVAGQTAEGGRELIELAPGAGFPCPAPSGTFTVADQNGAPQPASTSTPLFVGAGDTVTFDATPIQYLGAATQAYEWDFGDGTPTNPDTAITSTDPNTFVWPSPTISHQYTQTGTYTVTLKLFGDFGEYDESGAIQVGVNTPPIGTFTFAPDGQQAGSPVSFDATGSTPSPSASIIDYHWDWGDGTFDDTPAATDSHAYAAPGTYTTTLTVLDSRYGHGAPVSQTVTVVTPAPPPPPSTTPTTNTPPPPPPPPPAPAVSASIASTASTAGVVRAVVYCHTGRVSCSGTVELKTRPAVAARKKQKSTVVVLGRATFRVRGGKHETVYIHLSAKARSLLRRSRTLPVAATITVAGASGPPITTLQPRTLRFASAKAQAKRKRK